MRVAPIMFSWSTQGGVHVLRLLMWAHTTPAMIYLLSLLADFSRQKVQW